MQVLKINIQPSLAERAKDVIVFLLSEPVPQEGAVTEAIQRVYKINPTIFTDRVSADQEDELPAPPINFTNFYRDRVIAIHARILASLHPDEIAALAAARCIAGPLLPIYFKRVANKKGVSLGGFQGDIGARYWFEFDANAKSLVYTINSLNYSIEGVDNKPSQLAFLFAVGSNIEFCNSDREEQKMWK